jgi:hypothetical protein
MQMHTGPLSGLSDGDEDEADADADGDETSQERMAIGRPDGAVDGDRTSWHGMLHPSGTDQPPWFALLALLAAYHFHREWSLFRIRSGREQTVVSALFRNESLFLSSCECRAEFSNFSHMLRLVNDGCSLVDELLLL